MNVIDQVQLISGVQESLIFDFANNCDKFNIYDKRAKHGLLKKNLSANKHIRQYPCLIFAGLQNAKNFYPQSAVRRDINSAIYRQDKIAVINF